MPSKPLFAQRADARKLQPGRKQLRDYLKSKRKRAQLWASEKVCHMGEKASALVLVLYIRKSLEN